MDTLQTELLSFRGDPFKSCSRSLCLTPKHFKLNRIAGMLGDISWLNILLGLVAILVIVMRGTKQKGYGNIALDNLELKD